MKLIIKTNLLLLFFSCLFVNFNTYSQNETSKKKQNKEIKIDVFDLAVFTALEVTYEKLLENDTGYGLTIYLNFREEDTFYETFALTSFYRLYFLNGKDFGSKGYFAETFFKFSSGKNFENDYYNPENKNFSDLGLGLVIGKKWVNNKGMTLETSIGAGRNFGLNENSPELTIRGGVSIGYRF
jgi:hypothetical protein